MIPGAAAHLWQTTLFAGAAWLAALALGRNRAQVRYWVWFTASAKFLIPFSWLVGLGTLMPHREAARAIRTEWVAAIMELSQPLTLPAVGTQVDVTAGAAHLGYLRAAAVVLWACGFAAVTICWLLRWRRVDALRHSARAIRVPTALKVPVRVMSASDLIEPGVFGVLRPVLLLPEGITERLNQAQLDAILAHEFCHVRRRDNLTATFHMAVQAIFWFHPLTWWIGARLVDERERACDEEVLRLGWKPSVYAESILMVCKLYLSSPLACVSGVTGPDLKRRIESIMRNRCGVGLTLGRKLALGVAGMAALVAPMVVGIVNAAVGRAQEAADWQKKAGGKMAFEVASIKLNTGEAVRTNVNLNSGEAYHPTGGAFRANFPLWSYIQFAYKIWPTEEENRVTLAHLPAWVTTERYSIDARAAGNPTKDQMRLMVQALLAERFHLAAHFETREVPVFALTLVKAGKLGPKLRPHADGPACGDYGAWNGTPAADGTFPPVCDSLTVLRKQGGALMQAGYRNATMDMVADSLAGIVGEGRTLVDKTGFSGRFDFTLEWAPETNGAAPSGAATATLELPGPTAFEALRDQLGLKLEPARGLVQTLVIDKVERPSEN